MPYDRLDLSSFAAVLLDLDGTLLCQSDVLPGAVELIAALQQRRQPWAVLSNSTDSPRSVADRLRAVGITLNDDDVQTAAAAACDEALRMGHGHRPRIFNCCSPAVDELLHGRAELLAPGERGCDAVIVGTPTSGCADQDRQRESLLHLRDGASLIGVCADRIFPSRRGIEFGVGALTQMLSYAASCEPVFCGKPEQRFFEPLCQRLGVDPHACVIIGDNLQSDIRGGHRMGMQTVLVASGVADERDLRAAPDDQRPHHVVEDLRALR